MALNWRNELYVKIYIRDSDSWNLLSWQAKTVFLALLRKLDRTGRREYAKGDKGLAKTLGDFPVEIVSAGILELCAEGKIVISDGHLFVPSFVDSQFTSPTNAARQAAFRAKQQIVTDRNGVTEIVTDRNGVTEIVTDRNGVTEIVTSNDTPTPTPTPTPKKQKPCASESQLRGFDVIQITPDERWVITDGHIQAVYDRYPRKLGKMKGFAILKIKIRTLEAYNRLMRAVDVFAKLMKETDRPEDKIPYFSTWANSQWQDYVDLPIAVDPYAEYHKAVLRELQEKE